MSPHQPEHRRHQDSEHHCADYRLARRPLPIGSDDQAYPSDRQPGSRRDAAQIDRSWKVHLRKKNGNWGESLTAHEKGVLVKKAWSQWSD
jgi:hypothetical protein